eukprot:2100755-Amphidinium_carterae.1
MAGSQPRQIHAQGGRLQEAHTHFRSNGCRTDVHKLSDNFSPLNTSSRCASPSGTNLLVVQS